MTKMIKSGVTTDYIYDVENRLTQVKKSGSVIANYEYDGDGGRTKKIVTSAGGFAPGSQSNVNGQKSISFGFLYDIAATDGASASPNDPSTSLGTSEPLSTSNATNYIGSLYEETSGVGTKFIFLGGTRVAAINSGKLSYYHMDHLGGTNVVTDALGVKKELMEYKPFDEVARNERYGSDPQTAWYYYTGKPTDEETGLIYFGARYYSPTLGRFITPDTIVQSPSNPQTLNRYTYCNNNPVNLIDPSGHSWFKKFWKSLVSGVAGIAAFVGSGFNPVVGFQVFSMVNSGLNLGQALVTGQGIGRAFGTFAASLAISAGFGVAGFHDIVNVGMRMGAFVVEGAAIGAAGAAINGGDYMQSIAIGAGLGATMGFLSSEQFTNYRKGSGFLDNKELAEHNNIRARRVSNWLEDYDKNNQFAIGTGEGHSGATLIDSDGGRMAKGFWPKNPPGRIGALLGKTSPGEIRNEAGLWGGQGGFDTGRTYAVNSVQAVMIKQYMTATPQVNWALTTNCTDWAIGAAVSGGIYIPKNSYSSFGFADPATLKKSFREN